VSSIIAEVLLCTKEVNERARSAAFALIVGIGDAILGHQAAGAKVITLDAFATTVAAGLAGTTPHMIGATVLALARIIFQVSTCCKK
jgi:ribosomal RNA-processing protein 12